MGDGETAMRGVEADDSQRPEADTDIPLPVTISRRDREFLHCSPEDGHH